MQQPCSTLRGHLECGSCRGRTLGSSAPATWSKSSRTGGSPCGLSNGVLTPPKMVPWSRAGTLPISSDPELPGMPANSPSSCTLICVSADCERLHWVRNQLATGVRLWWGVHVPSPGWPVESRRFVAAVLQEGRTAVRHQTSIQYL